MALIIDIKVIPQSGKQMFKLDKTGQLTCYIKSAPEKGQANAEVVKMFSKALKIPMAFISIIGGKTSRKKRIKIESDLSESMLMEFLGIHKQLTMF